MTKKLTKTLPYKPTNTRSEVQMRLEFAKTFNAKHVPLHVRVPLLAALSYALMDKLSREGKSPLPGATAAEYVPYVLDLLHKAGQIEEEPNVEALNEVLHPEEVKEETVDVVEN